LTYEFHLLPPDGYADNIGVGFNITPNSSSSAQNFTLYPAQTLELFLFDGETTAEFLNLTQISVSSDLISYDFNTSNGTYYLNPIIPGNYTLQFDSAGYNTIYRYITIGEDEYNSMDVYMTQGGNLVTFTVIDNLGNNVDGAIIGVRYFVNGTEVFVGQRQTDLSGSAQMVLNGNLTYTITANKDGFDTFSGTLTPFQSSYIINLESDNLNRFTSVFNDISYRTNLNSPSNESWAFATFDVVSASGSLRSFSMSTTYNSITYSQSTLSDPNGGTLSFNITNLNVTAQPTVTIYYSLRQVGGDLISWNETYLLQGTFDGNNLISVDITGFPTGFKAVLAAIIIVLMVIFGLGISGRMVGGSVAGLLGVGVTVAINLLTLIPGLLTIGVLIILLLTDMRTGENR